MIGVRKNILVSVCMISYNHSEFIYQAIDSVLMQNTNFQYEIVIGDDCSSDNTPQILQEYESQHPDKIRLLLRNPNVGIANNFGDTILQCKGKYIAILEGDDYWIDENKLQKQVDFMEANSEYSLCYTHCKEVNESQGTSYITNIERPEIVDLSYILREGWFMRTPTLFFRNGLVQEFPDWFYTAYSTDYILHILLAEHGRVRKLEDVTAVYRKHDRGISVVNAKKQLQRFEVKLKLLDTINKYLNYKFDKEIKTHQKNIYEEIVFFSIRYKLWTSLLVKSVFNMNWFRFLVKVKEYLLKSIINTKKL
jgi:glycosyltransferase involved in cell wall biosynthesis